MPWTPQDYPAAMKSLTPEVRNKAIEIANSLLEKEGYPEERAIPIAIDTAEVWARNRGKPVKQKQSSQ